MKEKRCSKCGLTKDTSEFSRDSRAKDGLRQQCKTCRCTYQKQYYKENTQEIAEYYKEWRKKNIDKLNKYSREWAKEHPETVKSNKKEWKIKNPGAVRAHTHTYQARKIGASGSHTAADIKHQYEAQEGRCYWCGAAVGDNYHVDHVIPLAKGGSNGPENLVIACPPCNLSKGAKLPHEWRKQRTSA